MMQLHFANRYFLCLIGALFTLTGLQSNAVAFQNDRFPGEVVTESLHNKKFFATSPSITKISNGDYLISVSYSVPSGEKRFNQTEVFGSKNQGRDWDKLSTIDDLVSAAFVTKGDQVFLSGITRSGKSYPTIVVSADNGATWSNSNSSKIGQSRYYCRTTPNLIYNDRIWRSCWDVVDDRWSIHLLWAPYESDWLDGNNWTKVTPASGDIKFLGDVYSPLHQGNPIPTPDGVAVMAGCKSKLRVGTAALLPVSADGKSLEFDEATSLFDFPGGGAKFVIRFDEKSQKYWAIVNKQKDPFALYNNQVLVSSSNLRDWTVNSVLFRHRNDYEYGKLHADWQFDGDDLISVSVVAWEGSKNARKPTYTVFDRIKNFRSLNSTKFVDGTEGQKLRLFTSKSATVTGKYVETKTLSEGVSAVSHFAAKYKEIPKRIEGWKLFRTRGGFPSEITVEANSDCEIFMVTDLGGTGVIDVSGWTRETEILKKDNNVSSLFSRKLKRGDKVELPQGTWSGSQLLLPPDF